MHHFFIFGPFFNGVNFNPIALRMAKLYGVLAGLSAIGLRWRLVTLSAIGLRVDPFWKNFVVQR